LFSCRLLPASLLAGTVVFTDSQHLPANLPPDVPVVLLDGPDRLQADMFGELPADPQQAEAQVRQL
jgi:integrating conjugative element protein (TIGR03757 family)